MLLAQMFEVHNTKLDPANSEHSQITLGPNLFYESELEKNPLIAKGQVQDHLNP